MVQERPYVAQVLQVQMLDEIAGIMEDNLKELAELRREFSLTIPRGKVIPRELVITQTRPVELSIDNDASMPWISFDMFNDGPGSIRITVNEDHLIEKGWLASGESLTVDMKVPIIERIWFHTLTAAQATIRIFAKR